MCPADLPPDPVAAEIDRRLAAAARLVGEALALVTAVVVAEGATARDHFCPDEWERLVPCVGGLVGLRDALLDARPDGAA